VDLITAQITVERSRPSHSSALDPNSFEVNERTDNVRQIRVHS